ncbi:hypothetical protein MIND_01318400 [Mycena indigotica]|uniref:DUF6593 domain-containing protein n=1 Tax=Mycena indigotica TaxID=2126181 RepID=A0A8H6S210_9AGAR|nr:uncharacterized protein MIND_01318400 [Mycena indigotica]KAF7290775.1 hypothetical protein MIND_01318400 [Mycena indigotica]
MAEKSTAATTTTVLEFATNSVRNTTLATSSDDPYFEIVTRFWHPHVTKINKLEPGPGAKLTTVAEIDTSSNARVRFYDDDKKSEKGRGALGEWIDSTTILKLADGKPGGTYIDSDGIEYRWKTHNRNFQLYRVDDTTRLPIAVFHPCKRHFGVWRMSEHARLEVKSQIKHMERLIASFLLVERQRRHKRFSYRK